MTISQTAITTLLLLISKISDVHHVHGFVTNPMSIISRSELEQVHAHAGPLKMVSFVPDPSTPISSKKKTEKSSSKWTPDSWRKKVGKQMPVYEDSDELKEVTDKLANSAPLVFAGEVRNLSDQLAKASVGNAFLLMGGDCAESFKEFNVKHVKANFQLILQMALVLTFGSSLPVIKVGRMAGQFAKPRSAPTEEKDGISLPSYRGDIVNEEEFTPEARRNNPWKMLQAFQQSAQTLNLLRAFSTGGFADISLLHAWNLDFVSKTEEGSRYRALCDQVEESIRFLKAIGANTAPMKKVDFFTAHECLLLEYEQALTRKDSTTNDWYDCSSHMLWVGERTRDLDSAHLEFTRGINNPLGVKISDKCSPEELVTICKTMNPSNIPGRLTIIVRMGADNVRSHLPSLIRAVEREALSVVWISDPVHGNTRKTNNGYKTRDFNAIRAELRAFFDVHDKMGTHPGGVHLEMTGEDVTECVGGVSDVTEETLPHRYNTACDPRLNGQQALELAFLIAERMSKRRTNPSSKDWFTGMAP